MGEIVQSALGSFGPEIASGVFMILSLAFTYGVKKLRDFVDAKVKNEELNEVIDTVTELATNSVKASAREVRDDIKQALKDGDLSKEERQQIKQRALVKARSKLTQDGRKKLDKLFGSAEEYLHDKIESSLFDAG